MNVTVISSNPTKNGSFCTKLESKSVISIKDDFLGVVEQERKQTFYLFTKDQLEAGKSGAINMDNFDLVNKAHTAIDSDSGEEIQMELKYLYPKA